MKNDKAPGPNGFTTNLFHVCWDTIKEEILEINEDSKITGKFLKAFNSNFLSLIPKEMEPTLQVNSDTLFFVT